MVHDKRWLITIGVGTLGLALVAAPAVFGGDDPLMLKVNDMIGEPGGLVAVVLRSWAPRGIGQGQVDRQSASQNETGVPEVPSPFASLEGVMAFGETDDAAAEGRLENVEGEIRPVVEFSSAYGTINEEEGPLFVLFLRLRADLVPGQRFLIEPDPENTFAFGPEGEDILLRLRGRRLRIRAPGDPYQVTVEGDRVRPGQAADLGITTFETRPLSRGQVGLRYDPAVASGPPLVEVDRRFGNVLLQVDTATPGLLVISFESPDGSFNLVPGQSLGISLPTSRSVSPGTSTPITIDPALTSFTDTAGLPVPLDFEDAVLKFRLRRSRLSSAPAVGRDRPEGGKGQERPRP